MEHLVLQDQTVDLEKTTKATGRMLYENLGPQ